MADVSVSVGAPSQISVTVAGSSGGSALVTNGSVATVTVTQAGDRGPKGDPGSVNLSDATPLALGTAAAGSSSLASRADHTHPTLTTFPYASLSGVPSTFAPASHTHTASQVTDFATQAAKYGPVTSVNGQTGAVTVTTGGGATLSDATPSALGTASAGTSSTASRSDHVHLLPSLSTLGAAAANHAHNYVTALNSLTGGLTLAAGTGVTLTASGSTITIASTGGGSSDVDGGDYTGTLVYDRTITITQQPTDQSAVSGAATISVTATASPAGTLTYQWQRYQSSAWANVTGATSASLALTGLTTSNNGDRYRCVISAQSAASVTSGESLLGVNPTAPGVPTGLSAVRGDSSITLSWTAPASNGGSAITDYVVQHSNNSGSTWTTFSDGTSTATSATLTGLDAGGGFYSLRVAAVNAIGQSAYATLGSPIKFGPALLSVSSNTVGATVTGLGDSSTPLVVTRTTTSQNAFVTIKTANTSGTHAVSWYMTVTGGPVGVTSDSGLNVVVNDTYTASTNLSPTQEMTIVPQGYPFSFTFTAQR